MSEEQWGEGWVAGGLKRGVPTGKSPCLFSSLLFSVFNPPRFFHKSFISAEPLLLLSSNHFFRLCAIQTDFSWLAPLTFHSFSSLSLSLCLCSASLPPLHSTTSSLCRHSVIFRDNGVVAVIDFDRGVSEWRVCVTAEPSAPSELPIIDSRHRFFAGPFSSPMGQE